MKKDKLIITAIVFLGLFLYLLTLRGAAGNPTQIDIKEKFFHKIGAFESSHEIGPFGHVVNLVERGSFDLTRDWANIATPDVGTAGGRVYTFFAPGTPYFAVPFYWLGAKFGLAQVFVFYMESLLGVISLVFLYKISRSIFNLSPEISLFSVLVFAFASTSWSYFITLYQHAPTVFFMATAFWAAWRFTKTEGLVSWLYASWVWAAFALSITVEYPNAVMMLPIMVYLAIKTFSLKRIEEGFSLSIKWAAIGTFLVFVLITGLHFWHNATYYGAWNNVAGGLAHYSPDAPDLLGGGAHPGKANAEKIATFFSEKNFANSSYVLLFSSERGLFFFSPIFILSLFGIWMFSKKARELGVLAEYILALALILTNLALYSSWGDPWGGWAFGPRYLIPTMAFLSIFVGVFISQGAYARTKKILAFLLFLYSSAVALVGALTTNAVPTKGEAMLLPIKKYNFLKNIDLVFKNESGSFIYNTYLSEKISLEAYYLIIYIAIALVVALVLILSRNKCHG